MKKLAQPHTPIKNEKRSEVEDVITDADLYKGKWIQQWRQW